MAERGDGTDRIIDGRDDDDATPMTSDHADDYLRRVSLWSAIKHIFREDRPTEEDLGRVSILAEVAIDQVFQAHNVMGEHADRRHGEVKDFAECAALYGFVLGLHYGKTRTTMALGATPSGD